MKACFGFSETVLEQLQAVFEDYVDIDAVWIYGSRARGDFREGSDVDIAIDAPKMSALVFAQLWNAIEGLPVVYTFDVVHLQKLVNQPLLKNIGRDKQLLYRRK